MAYKYPLICIPAAGLTIEEVDNAAHDVMGGNIEWSEIIGDYIVLGFFDHVGECEMLHDQITAGPTFWYQIGTIAFDSGLQDYWMDDPDYRTEDPYYAFFDKPAKQFELKHLSIHGKLIYRWKDARKGLSLKKKPKPQFSRFMFGTKEKM
jgi:hypothetical protein